MCFCHDLGNKLFFMKKLSSDDFRSIIRNTPLVAIDLVIENSEGKILLGERENLPAKSYWFVPGGRIYKDEKFASAFQRILKDETGLDKDLRDSNFLGIYEHFYPGENNFEDPDYGTHYICIAFRIKVEETGFKLPSEQHSNYRWASLDEIESDPLIHINTKKYFNGFPSFSE